MSTVTIDTLAIAKRLQSAGCERKQAEAQAEVLSEVVEQNLATKRDLKELEYRLTIRLGSMMVVMTGVIVALMKIL